MSNAPQPLDRDRLLSLADKTIDGTASAEEAGQLETLLEQDADARRAYLRYALLCGQLSLTEVDVHAARPDQPAVGGSGRAFRLWRGAAMAIAVAATILVAVFVGPRLLRDGAPPDERPIATRDGNRDDSLHYDNRDLPLQTVATLRPTESVSRRISSTTLRVQRGAARFDSVSGAAVRVEGPAMFGISSRSSGVLFSGSVHTRLEKPDSTYSIVTSNLRIVDLGTEFRVTVIDNEHVRVHVLDGEVDVQSRVRLPLYYWNFDRPRGSLEEKDAVDDAAHISLGAAARRVEGLIGSGAIDFDNTPASAVRIDDSAGDHVGEGRMACSVGITIEAVFVSRWTGKNMDYDEIFRKEDGDYRMLLSFQNDGDDYDYDFPQVEPGPCLSFGLHLEQHGAIASLTCLWTDTMDARRSAT